MGWSTKNPFVFLMMLENCSPKCHIKISGTSVDLERNIDVSLARDIMRGTASIPVTYKNNKLALESSIEKTIKQDVHENIPQERYPELNTSMYYSDDFIDSLQKNNVKNVAIVVTSWSDGALLFPRSAHIGSRQSRDLPHHCLMAQKLKRIGIFFKIYYLAFDNTLHFNQKDKRAVDTSFSPSYKDYLLSFDGEALEPNQIETIYLNPQYGEKEGDIVIEELAPIVGLKGNCLSFSGKNAVEINGLKHKIAAHKDKGDLVLGMTAHSAGNELSTLSNHLGLEIIGCSKAALKYGTKEGNKVLFQLAQVPYVYGTHVVSKNIDELISYCFLVALRTHCKRLMIKHNSSSAGKGNLVINISSAYHSDGKGCSFSKLKALIKNALINYRHPEKDVNLKQGGETFYMRKIRELGAIVEEMIDAKNIVSPGSLAVVNRDGSVAVEYIYDQILTGKDGQNFGGSLGPSELEPNDIKQMNSLTKKIGEELYKHGFTGYFGLDFLKYDDDPLIVIEANIRKTGTRYPFMFVSHLFTEDVLKQKHLFHDDNIKLPFTVSDLNWRNFSMNHYVSELYTWLASHSITLSKKNGVGAIVSFDTHTAGKLGVLTIGDTRAQAIELNKEFISALDFFSRSYYFETNLPKQFLWLKSITLFALS